jgi:hypothetical protein
MENSENTSPKKSSLIRRFICFIGIHKWNFGSTILETKKKDINYCLKDYKIGERLEYTYKCDCCGYERIKVVSFSCFHYSKRWLKNT